MKLISSSHSLEGKWQLVLSAARYCKQSFRNILLLCPIIDLSNWLCLFAFLFEEATFNLCRVRFGRGECKCKRHALLYDVASEPVIGSLLLDESVQVVRFETTSERAGRCLLVHDSLIHWYVGKNLAQNWVRDY